MSETVRGKMNKIINPDARTGSSQWKVDGIGTKEGGVL